MLDHSRIKDLMAEIRRRTELLRETAEKVKYEEFIDQPILADATERRLQVAIQACLDIASHIVATMALEKPQKENKEVFTILFQHQIINKSLAEKLVSMAGMRNVLVHDYAEVNRDLVYKAIKNDLGDFREFVAQIQAFLERV